MGLFNWFKGGGTTIQQDLRELKQKFLALPGDFPSQASVVRFGGASRALQIIPGVCDDAIRALNEGLDVNNRPIDRADIANGLRRLVGDARTDAGLVATELNPDGVRLYGQYLDELHRIALRID
jgi:hypothetical protein